MIACQLHGRERRDKFLSHATLLAPSKPSGLSAWAPLRWPGIETTSSYEQYFVRTRYCKQQLRIGSCHGPMRLSDIVAHTYTKCMSMPRWAIAACTDCKSLSNNGHVRRQPLTARLRFQKTFLLFSQFQSRPVATAQKKGASEQPKLGQRAE